MKKFFSIKGSIKFWARIRSRKDRKYILKAKKCVAFFLPFFRALKVLKFSALLTTQSDSHFGDYIAVDKLFTAKKIASNIKSFFSKKTSVKEMVYSLYFIDYLLPKQSPPANLCCNSINNPKSANIIVDRFVLFNEKQQKFNLLPKYLLTAK